MNCLEFRRSLLCDPQAYEHLGEHASQCPQCARFAERQEGIEKGLDAALRVAPPQDLVRRILRRHDEVTASEPVSCLEFRRLLGSDPYSRDPRLQRHLRDCPACARHARDLHTTENRLRGALRVAEPEGLAARVLLRKSFADRGLRGRPRVHASLWGIAASVLLGLAAVTAVYLGDPGRALSAEIIAHIEGEPAALAPDSRLPPVALNELLRPVGVELTGEIGPLRHASLCPISERLGAHLVVAGARAPVTVLVMPGQPVRRRTEIRDAQWAGVLLPVRGGSMAIVGVDGEDLRGLEARLRASVRLYL